MSRSSPRIVLVSRLLPWLALIGTGCGASPDASPGPGEFSTSGTTGSEATDPTGGAVAPANPTGTVDPTDAADANTNPLGRARCSAPEGVSGSPGTIEEAVALVNALPKPTSVACFVESLDRPLAAYATNSPFSAQPADGSESPRVFLKFGQLWLSIVMDGDSSYLIEFGYELPYMRSIKAELQGPFLETVTPSAPYDRILFGQGTVCGVCHHAEEPSEAVSFATAFESASFRPVLDSYVSISELADEARACDWNLEPHRCEMLSALFDGGPVVEQPFPDSMPTFF